jgi:lysophospholipase L1-like esterase
MPDSHSIAENHKVSDHSVILFQGDSITDAGRNRNDENNPNQFSMLGNGYAMFAAASLLATHPDKNLKIYNRGVGGNKVFQLQERWEKDCFDLAPDVISILIGVNDFWHTKSHGYEGTLATYEADYRNLISNTKKRFPRAKIIICEPFIIAGGTVVDDTWEAGFDGYRTVAKKLGMEFQTAFIPYQKIFNEALKKAPASYWGGDGVHPSMAGAQLMAQAWLKVL